MSPVTEIVGLELRPPTEASHPGLHDAWAVAQAKLREASEIEYNLWRNIHAPNYLYMIGGWRNQEVQTAYVRDHGPELLKPFVSYLIRRFAHHISINIDSVARDKALLVVTIVSIHGQKDTFKASLGEGLTNLRKVGFPDALTATGDFAHPPRRPIGLTESGSESANPPPAPANFWVSYSGCDTEEQAANVVEAWNALVSGDELVGLEDVQHLHLRKYL